MKNTNKLVALILTALMLAGSNVAYADTASDPASPDVLKPAMEEQPQAEVTPAPEATQEPAPTEETVNEQPQAEATPTPEVTQEPAPTEAVVEAQSEATPAPEVTQEPAPTEQAVEAQPAEEAPKTEAVITAGSENGAVTIYATASTDAEIIGQLSGNDRVIVLGVEGDWTKVRANGVVGFVLSKSLQAVVPEATPAPEETAAPEVTPVPEETVAPEATPVPVETAAPEETAPAPFVSQYQRNEQGELVLDELGNPIPLTPPEGAVQYQRDASGNLILDENGEPILVEVPASAPEADRSDLSQAVIKTWMDAGENTRYGDTVTIFYEIQNFSGWEYTVQWQRKGADGWSDVPGATGKTYSFTLTEDNLNTEWRVRVDVAVPEAP